MEWVRVRGTSLRAVHTTTERLPGLTLTTLTLDVPLDHTDPGGV